MVTLLSFNIIAASGALALGLAAAPLVLDGLGWRGVAAIFDRERRAVLAVASRRSLQRANRAPAFAREYASARMRGDRAGCEGGRAHYDEEMPMWPWPWG